MTPRSKIADNTKGYFRKSEVMAEVLQHKTVNNIAADIEGRHPGWRLGQIFIRYIEGQIGERLGVRDANGLRIYENYGAGEKERRWLKLRAMDADTLRACMQQTRTQARELKIKSEGYEIILEELERLGAGATVDDAYDRVIDKIRQHRAA